MSLRNRAANLDDLLDESEVEILQGEQIIKIPKDTVYVGDQVRKNFNQEKIAKLSTNMEENGQLKPIIVWPIDSKGYKVHQGGRRYRAAMMSDSITHIDCIVRSKNNIIMQLSENIHAEGLNPFEVGEGIVDMMSEFDMSLQEAAVKLGISSSLASAYKKSIEAPEFIKDAYIAEVVGDVDTVNILRVAAKVDEKQVMAFMAGKERISRDEANVFKAKLKPSKAKAVKDAATPKPKVVKLSLPKKTPTAVKEWASKAASSYSFESLTSLPKNATLEEIKTSVEKDKAALKQLSQELNDLANTDPFDE